MIWFFERQQRRLHYEVRRQADGEGYEIVISHPDGRLETERYADTEELLRRTAVLQITLIDEGWSAPSPGIRSTGRSSRQA